MNKNNFGNLFDNSKVKHDKLGSDLSGLYNKIKSIYLETKTRPIKAEGNNGTMTVKP